MTSRTGETRGEKLSHTDDSRSQSKEKGLPVIITVMDYNESQFQEIETERVEDCYPFKDKPTVTWINVNGIHQSGIVEKIVDYFGLHPLVLEDIMSTGQRPKMEDFEEYIFMVLNMTDYSKKSEEVAVEQVSLVLGSNFLISFQKKEGDVFTPIRDRIRKSKGRVRRMGPDYLAYTLIDAVVDNYFTILERIGEEIEFLEEDLVTDPTPEILQGIYRLKKDMMFLRKSVWPLREIISSLERSESPLIKEPVLVYIRDVYGHTIQVMDTIDTLRDMISGMLDIYLSSISNRMNEVMKVLTIIATIFIPLTLISGIYGMNFQYMPELGWRWGYPTALSIMLLIGLLMLAYFKKKHWL